MGLGSKSTEVRPKNETEYVFTTEKGKNDFIYKLFRIWGSVTSISLHTLV